MSDNVLTFLMLLLKFTPTGIGFCIFAVLMNKRNKKRALIRTAIRIQMEQLQAQRQPPPVQPPSIIATGHGDQSFADIQPFQRHYRTAHHDNEIPLLAIVSATGGDTNESSEKTGKGPIS